MTLDQAKAILDPDVIHVDGLFSLGWYLSYTSGDKDACLDGRFTADELEAIAVCMRASSTVAD